ncbi:MAG: hypothetical protein J5546_09770, partial [Lachnospiraceae bacterium]|nr:hypothetical protein [Lachnospiraceae bacterium]
VDSYLGLKDEKAIASAGSKAGKRTKSDAEQGLTGKKSDAERIIEICKNQYAEAKIARQALAVYWRQFPSGVDGQTICYFAEHPEEL